MKATKRIVALVLAVITALSISVVSAGAATYIWTDNSFNTGYCTATLTKPGKKNGSVKVTIVSTTAATVRMTDNRGRYIWGENNAIKVGGVMPTGNRTFKLGKDHSVYRIYIKTRYPGTASFSNAKNCTIK